MNFPLTSLGLFQGSAVQYGIQQPHALLTFDVWPATQNCFVLDVITACQGLKT